MSSVTPTTIKYCKRNSAAIHRIKIEIPKEFQPEEIVYTAAELLDAIDAKVAASAFRRPSTKRDIILQLKLLRTRLYDKINCSCDLCVLLSENVPTCLFSGCDGKLYDETEYCQYHLDYFVNNYEEVVIEEGGAYYSDDDGECYGDY